MTRSNSYIAPLVTAVFPTSWRGCKERGCCI